jgi:argonaute-like protein implicated in RNA metabolism and viral defense
MRVKVCIPSNQAGRETVQPFLFHHADTLRTIRTISRLHSLTEENPSSYNNVCSLAASNRKVREVKPETSQARLRAGIAG